MKMFVMTIATAASAALLVPTVAEARSYEAYEESSAKVKLDDLDLSTASGQVRLERRIARALQEVCGDPRQRHLKIAAHVKACIEQGRQQAAPQVRLAVNRAQKGKRAA